LTRIELHTGDWPGDSFFIPERGLAHVTYKKWLYGQGAGVLREGSTIQ